MTERDSRANVGPARGGSRTSSRTGIGCGERASEGERAAAPSARSAEPIMVMCRAGTCLCPDCSAALKAIARAAFRRLDSQADGAK